MDVYFYTRPHCHLCEEAKSVMAMVKEKIAIELHERNIDENDQWTENYGLMIPVIEFNNKVVEYGKIDYVSVFKKLKKEVNK